MMILKSEVLKQQEQKSKERNTQPFKSLYITAVSFLVKKGKYPTMKTMARESFERKSSLRFQSLTSIGKLF
jgi:hypothetical protein